MIPTNASKVKNDVSSLGVGNTRKAPNKRSANPTEREDVLARVATLYRRGHSIAQIAEMENVCYQQARMDVQQIRKRFTKSLIKDYDSMVQEKIMHIREVMREAWEQWDRSKLDEETVASQNMASQFGNATKESLSRKGRTGDVGYLNLILRCIESERVLLGLDKPKKVDIRGAVLDWDKLVQGLPVGPVPDAVERTIENVVKNPPPLEIKGTSRVMPGDEVDEDGGDEDE